MSELLLFHSCNLNILRDESVQNVPLIYIDPPFNTKKVQKRKRKEKSQEKYQYEDTFDDFLSFIRPRLQGAYDKLTDDGSFFLHLDCREVHYAKVELDKIFGRESFMNEIVWAYDYGGRSKKKWSQKHDNILWYVKDPKNYTFNFDEMDRIPYMAPGLVGPEKTARGKTPTDCWWHTIVSPNGKEKTGYPTQKPLGILERIIKVHSNEGDWVMDFFAGSGSFGEAAIKNNRNAILVDKNPDAIDVIRKRIPSAKMSHEKSV